MLFVIIFVLRLQRVHSLYSVHVVHDILFHVSNIHLCMVSCIDNRVMCMGGFIALDLANCCRISALFLGRDGDIGAGLEAGRHQKLQSSNL